MPYAIPFNKPSFQGAELAYIAEAIAAGHISGDGPFTKRCHALLEEALGIRKALLTTSCTQALEMAAMLIGAEGGEVIVPSFSFVTTANAFASRGLRPVFCDVRPDTLNIDESRIEALITERTRAIVPVHYGGVACEMDGIMAIAAARSIAVIEDNAHGLFGRYKERPLGSIGTFGTLSFHETKNFTCGEGGALLINDARYVARAEILREKGTDRSRMFRGEVDKYTWVDFGGSFLPSDALAAFLFAQLEARERIQADRRAIWERYAAALGDWAARLGVQLPVIPEACESAYHNFWMLMPGEADRDALIARLKAKGILAVFHYLPLHLSAMGRRFGGFPGQCPVTESVAPRLVRLPFYNGLTEAEQARVVEAVAGT